MENDDYVYMFEYTNININNSNKITIEYIDTNRWSYNNNLYIELLYNKSQTYPITPDDLLSCIFD